MDLDLQLGSARGRREACGPMLWLRLTLGTSEDKQRGLWAKMLTFRVAAACISGEILAPGCQWSMRDHFSKAVVSSKEIRWHRRLF